MKVLHIIPSLIKGGAERITLDICSQLQQYEKHEVKLVYFRDINNYEAISNQLDVSLIDLSFKLSLKGKSTGNVTPLQTLIDNFEPDVIHSHLFESEIMLSQIKYLKARYIVHFHDNMHQFRKWKGGLSKKQLTNWYERKTVLSTYKKKNVSFIGISKDTMEYIQANISKHFPTYFLLNAIDLERFRVKDNIARDEFRLVMVGSLVNKKNQQLAIRIVKYLNDKGYPFTLDILGDGPNKNDLTQLVNELHLGKSVFLRGNVDQPEEFLHRSGIYLHTATYEPFGLVLIEAMAAEIPVICTDGKGNRDVILHGENGLMDTTFEVENIANLILKLHEDASLKNRIVKNALAFSNDYDIKIYVEKLLEIYREDKKA